MLREGAEKANRQGRSSKSASGWSNTSSNQETLPVKSRSSSRTRGKPSQAFSSDDEAPAETSRPTRRSTTYTFKGGYAQSYRKSANSDTPSTPGSMTSSTMYSSPGGDQSSGLEDSGGGGSNQSLFSTGLSPVRPDTPPLSLVSRSTKYMRRPLHPPNNNSKNSNNNESNHNHMPHSRNNYVSSNTGGTTGNGFSDDELDNQEVPPLHRYYRPMSLFNSLRNKGIPMNYSSGSSLMSQSSYLSGAAYGGLRNLRRPQLGATTGATRSHFVPKLLTWITVIFFLGLAVLYYRLGQDAQPSVGAGVPSVAELIKYDKCSKRPNAGEEAGYTCIPEELFGKSLEVASKIQTLLEQKKYEQVCGNEDSNVDERLTYEEAARHAGTSLDNGTFISAVYLITQNPSWGVEVSRDSEDTFLMPHYLAPLWCRLQRAVMQMFLQALLFVFFVVVVACTYWYLQNRKVNYRERRRQINGLVEDITDLLTNNAADNPETPYLPILEIRDKLLPTAAMSRNMAQLWREVEDKFEQTEGARVAREKQRVRGEWFQVWRWLSPPTTTVNGQWAMGNKVWQGKAFDGSSAGRPLTNCLKIKNMFNKLEERGEGWVQDVQRELLTKCGPNHGIVHMHVAEDSPDGIVYAKMLSLEAAGEVYRKLHGSWFDRRLVTAKYLREKRYHEKFPESSALASQMDL
ncbi:inner nuclear membrane protein Man1-like isoform X2 [Varroa destructor]|uniref:Man1/Src1-like C-terminal domain-containing protein n=1 Tax=Varroa destructor TaxID=109461 RepID=A0A7M7KB93_VARDE|nr:inner nuclear membrane protein Man1-like isoform X2 [Varroa destructor]